MEAGGRRGAPATPREDARAQAARRWRLLHHGLPALGAIALVALVLGLIAGTGPGRAEHRIAERFAQAWAAGDYGGMYALLDDASRRATPFEAFAAAYRSAARTATLRELRVEEVGERDGATIPLTLRAGTRVFGTLRAVAELPVSGSGEELRIAWHPGLTFPGVGRGEQLARETALPSRAALIARDGTVLAEGEARTSGDPELASHVVGRLEPAPPEQRGALEAAGYPDGARVGVSGLERAFERRLAGRPGGTLRAGGRVLARTAPRPAPALRTTIDPAVQRAAVAALAGRYGGIAALDPRTGEVLALAGVAYSALQPPGSTFKIVTLAGALEAGIASRASRYPVATEAVLEGVPLENANGESCGGSLTASFAHSCNSVFAPLGAELGARRLVAVAERFGFNAPIPIAGAATSTLPPASTIGDDLAVGSTAIGQGLVQATALQMTSVAAAIATRGVRAAPTLRLGERPRAHRVTSRRVAREVARMMRAVVEDGTGAAAAIAGVPVAGKTGTAELESTVTPAPTDPVDALPADDAPAPRETDAWFVAYAPATRPRIAVGALFVEAGTGGDVAAPAVRQVLLAALQGGG